MEVLKRIDRSAPMPVAKIETEYLMTLQGTIALDAAISVNNKLIFEVRDASFEGPEVKGKIIPPAGDWIDVRPNGTWNLDVRMSAELDDGSHAYFHYSGIVSMTESLMGRVGSGEELTGDDIYFRAAPYIETNSETYAWLNDIVCIGKLRSFAGGTVVYDIFKVL